MVRYIKAIKIFDDNDIMYNHKISNIIANSLSENILIKLLNMNPIILVLSF